MCVGMVKEKRRAGVESSMAKVLARKFLKKNCWMRHYCQMIRSSQWWNRYARRRGGIAMKRGYGVLVREGATDRKGAAFDRVAGGAYLSTDDALALRRIRVTTVGQGEHVRKVIGRLRPRSPLRRLEDLNRFAATITRGARKTGDDAEPIRKTVGRSRPK